MSTRKPTAVWLSAAVAALGTMIFASGASAHSGEFARFNNCPSTNPEVETCLYAVTGGGEVVLGSKKVPIEKEVILQGGFTKAVSHVSKFVAATNGETLTKVPQNVPGGLAGLVPPEESPEIVKDAIKFFFENGLTGVNSTLELAKPASEIEISEFNLLLKEGVALKLPVKVHLENPFLGSNCYVGSSGSPIIWNLTTGETSPPGPNKSIEGRAGNVSLLEGFEIAKITGNELVDNGWSAPKVTGCGGFLIEYLVDPIIEAQLGSTKAGHNTAILKNTLFTASPEAVNAH
jgi:hypothetical protein